MLQKIPHPPFPSANETGQSHFNCQPLDKALPTTVIPAKVADAPLACRYPVPEIGSFAVVLFIRGPLDSGLRRSDGRLNSKCDRPANDTSPFPPPFAHLYHSNWRLKSVPPPSRQPFQCPHPTTELPNAATLNPQILSSARQNRAYRPQNRPNRPHLPPQPTPTPYSNDRK